MKRLLVITIGGLCLLTLGLGGSRAGPGDPIGGDDPGCAPATKDDLKCSDGSLKNFAKAWAAATKCHIKQADAAFKNGVPGDDAGCETSGAGKSAKEKFDAARATLACPANVTAPVNGPETPLSACSGTSASA